MTTLKTDVVILGAGTAGLNARREADKAGRDWLLVDPGPYGTTCARVGCMPSKLLIAAAEAAHEVQRAGVFGIDVTGMSVDGRAVMERVRRERDRFAGFVVRSTEEIPAARRPRQKGRLDGPNRVVLEDGTVVEAGAVVIATGSHPWVPPGFEAVSDRVLVNDDVFDWEDLPSSLAVLGAGVIGLELGQALARLGVDVHVFDPFDKVLGIADPVVQDYARRTFAEALPLHLGSTMEAAVPAGEGVQLTWMDADGTRHERTFDHVLAAAGRRPNLTGIGLETLDVELDGRGMPPIDPHTLQIGELPVFVAGDATGDRPLLHEAGDEGRIAGANAARFPDVTRGQRRVPLAVAFTEPQLAVIGASYHDLDDTHRVVGEVSFEDQGRSRVLGKNVGLARLYADRRSCKLVGATVFGPRAEHLGHLLAWAMASELTVNQVLERPFYHPVVEEGLRTALRALSTKLKTHGLCPPEDCAHGPGD